MKKAPPGRARSSSFQLVGNTTVRPAGKVSADAVGGLAGSAVSLERRSRATVHGHNQRSTSKTLTHSMALIADRDLVVELYGFPAPQAFRVGGKLGNAVIRSTVPTVHRGWRLVAVNGIRCNAEKAAEVLQHAAQHARYTATFHLGDAHLEEDPWVAERARVAAEDAEAEQREERERERRRAEAEEIERKIRAAEEEAERKRQVEAIRKQEEEEAAKREEEKRSAKQRQEEAAKQQAEEETKKKKVAEEAAARAEKQQRDEAEAKAVQAKSEAEEAEVRRREVEEKKRIEAAAEAERKLEAERKRQKEAEAEELQRLERAKEEEERRRVEEAQKKSKAEESERREQVIHQEEMVQAEKKLQKTTGLPPKADVPEPQKALMTALTNPTPTVVRKPQGPCDKCDGKHDTDSCPYFKNARETHKDAWDNYGTKGAAGGKGSQAILRTARVVPQPGDGSCLFHSLSYGLHSSTASKLRAEIADFIAANPNTQVSNNAIKDWVLWDSGMDTAAYAQSMRTGSRWGGAIELAVCAKVKRVRVHVYEKGREGFVRISSFEGDVGPGAATVNLLYGGRVHYDALQV